MRHLHLKAIPCLLTIPLLCGCHSQPQEATAPAPQPIVQPSRSYTSSTPKDPWVIESTSWDGDYRGTYLGNGYLLGREYFELAAMRHMPPEAAKQLRKTNRITVLLCGLIIAAVASVPILNLITPLFGTAFMVRIYKGLSRASDLRVAPRPAS